MEAHYDYQSLSDTSWNSNKGETLVTLNVLDSRRMSKTKPSTFILHNTAIYLQTHHYHH